MDITLVLRATGWNYFCLHPEPGLSLIDRASID